MKPSEQLVLGVLFWGAIWFGWTVITTGQVNARYQGCLDAQLQAPSVVCIKD